LRQAKENYNICKIEKDILESLGAKVLSGGGQWETEWITQRSKLYYIFQN